MDASDLPTALHAFYLLLATDGIRALRNYDSNTKVTSYPPAVRTGRAVLTR